MPNQGHIWSSGFQYGKETVPGDPVPATMKAYFDPGSMLTVNEAATEHRFAVGRRDNLLAITPGPLEAGGTVSLPVSAAELIELFQISVQGGVTPALLAGSTGVEEWVFKPSQALDAATFEWDDGANLWQGAGVQGDSVTFTGDASGDHTVSIDLFSTDVQALGALTGSLADRVPDFLRGWQTRLFIGSFGSAFNALDMIPGLMRNWTVTLNNGLGRFRTANNTQATDRVTTGELGITASLTFDAYKARAKTEFDFWRASTPRAIGLEFVGPPSGVEVGVNEVQTITYGSQTSGTWLPSFMGVASTVPVPWNATAAQLQASLRAIRSIGRNEVTVTGGPAPGTPHVVTFVNRWGEYNVPLITADITSLVGGVPAVTPAQTTAGRSGRRRIQVLLPGKWVSSNIGGSADGVRTYEMGLTAMYDPAVAAMAEFRFQNERTTAWAA